jgi:hypothetical protein
MCEELAFGVTECMRRAEKPTCRFFDHCEVRVARVIVLCGFPIAILSAATEVTVGRGEERVTSHPDGEVFIKAIAQPKQAPNMESCVFVEDVNMLGLNDQF